MTHSESTRQGNYVQNLLKEAKAVAFGSHWSAKLALPQKRALDRPGMVDQVDMNLYIQLDY